MTSTARIALGLSALVILTVRTTLVESSEAARARGPGGGIGTIRAATDTSRIAEQAKIEAVAGAEGPTDVAAVQVPVGTGPPPGGQCVGSSVAA